MPEDFHPFIGGPFIECPKCGGGDAFGVFLAVTANTYERRCVSCGHQERFSLPEIRKQVIYLDQFAVSNMAASADPSWSNELAGFWRDLMKILSRLVFLQACCCPMSNFHYEESVVSDFYEAKRFVSELFSAGARFHDYEAIRRFQVHRSAAAWANGSEDPGPEEGEAFIHSPHEWQPRLEVTARLSTPSNVVDDLVRRRDVLSEGLELVFRGWQSDPFDFQECFKEEGRAWGRTNLQLASGLLQDEDAMSAAILAAGGAPECFVILNTVRSAIEAARVAPEHVSEQTAEYLLSDAPLTMPFNRISSLLYAGLARKAAGGQKRPPTRGMTSDIQMISTLLPYCDAMFIDNECRALLCENPIAAELGFNTALYSLNNRGELLDWLAEIEAAIPESHFGLVRGLYGEPSS